MNSPASFSPHHVAISARNLDKSRAFYEWFGFRLVLLWEAADQSLRIAHLALPGGFVLEIFEYADNHSAPRAQFEMGNDLETIGPKHLGLRVSDIHDVHRRFKRECGDTGVTDIKQGRTQIDYFFVLDPDGTWVEVVQDDRALDLAVPTYLREE